MTSLEFYITPTEQQNWLDQLVSDSRVWCVFKRFGQTYREYPDGDDKRGCLQFDAKNERDLLLYIGHKEIVPSPVWRTTLRGQQDIDFKKSCAIQLIPSLVVNNEILLEGRLAILRKAEYEEEKINPRPLFHWFRKVVSTLDSLRFPGAVLAQQTTKGTIKQWKEVLVTPGAVQWWQKGYKLKQFPRGEVAFSIQIQEGVKL